jgi:hypothetical protein
VRPARFTDLLIAPEREKNKRFPLIQNREIEREEQKNSQ